MVVLRYVLLSIIPFSMTIEYKCALYVVDIAIKTKYCIYQYPGPYPCTLHTLNFQISNINMVFSSSV